MSETHASHGLIGPEAELRRLQMQEEVLDPVTDMVFRRVGVQSGWRCLEVGVGAGSVTRMLSERVGAGGHVLGADLDGRFFEHCAAENVTLRAEDIRTMQLPSGSLDLIHTRMTLIYFADDVDAVLRKLVSALKPGGWLVCEEADLSFAHRYAGDPAEAWLRYLADSIAAMSMMGADFTMGDRLPQLFASAGLTRIDADARAAYWLPGTVAAAHVYESIEFARPFLIQNRGYTDADLDDLKALISTGVVRTGYTLVSAWGCKPG